LFKTKTLGFGGALDNSW